jgi:hypothetical protein
VTPYRTPRTGVEPDGHASRPATRECAEADVPPVVSTAVPNRDRDAGDLGVVAKCMLAGFSFGLALIVLLILARESLL